MSKIGETVEQDRGKPQPRRRKGKMPGRRKNSIELKGKSQDKLR